MNKTVLITGASSGIGKATAELLASHKYRLILTARRRERLEQLGKEISEKYGTDVFNLEFDIRHPKEVKKALSTIPDSYMPVDILINNAGLAAGLNNLHEGDEHDWERMIDTNIKGLLYTTRFIAPMMVAEGNGHIINLSSIAGKETYPLGNVYCATKYAVESLTKAMRLEMLPYGIKVTSIAPGAVKTEFATVRFDGDQQKADAVYKGFKPLTPEDIAETIYFVITRPPHVNIDDILIMPTAQAFSRDFNRKL
jgi:3-hydroxy acid dehydrogenase / malonic semialdehyde reductase